MEHKNGQVLLGIVSALLMLDNLTLTMVVPIIPDFLLNVDSQLHKSSQESSIVNHSNRSGRVLGPQPYTLDLESENGRVGLLLSSKAILQLGLNPVIGYWTAHSGYSIPLFTGSVTLLLSIILFAAGDSFPTLFLARASHGLASSCIAITGMSLIAGTHVEPARSKAMGFALSSAAAGVLVGYPFGGFMYDLVGKTPPFLIISFIVFGLAVVQFYSLEGEEMENKDETDGSNWPILLKNHRILLCGGAIGVSTSAMAILEPCLPIWLMGHIKPKKWQLGTAFIPDSLGYALGTNAFSQIAYQVGRTRVAVVAMVVVGVSCIVIPLASSMAQLVVPHFLLGLGIGAVDAALVPLLASLADAQNSASYGTVYAIQQIVVSLAYALGPMVGGALVYKIGFPWLMTCVGLINFIYCLFLANFKSLEANDPILDEEISIRNNYHTSDASVTYKKFQED